MPSILLINDNKIVSRLLQLSSQKHDYTLEEINDYTASESSYNIVFIDSDKYDEDAFLALKETLTFDKLGFIGDKANTKPQEFDLVLEKPFLPTDFVSLMDENFKMMSHEDESLELDTIEDIEGEDELDLDSLDVVDEVEELDSFELDLDDDNLEELSGSIADPETTLTTGITENIVEDDSKEKLADIVNEIDSMEEEVLEEMDLDELDEEKDLESIVDDEIDSMEEEVLKEMDLDELDEEEDLESIVDDEMVKETIEEVESTIDELEEEVLEEVVEESSDVDAAEIVATVAATAATVAVVDVMKDEETQEELEETLNILDGVEGIENEDDYLKENDNVVQDLAGEFDSLNEAEVEKLMAAEEIVSEEFTTSEEKVVESNDLEEMITRAVAKAITKEMLQEALDDMEITVTLKSKKS